MILLPPIQSHPASTVHHNLPFSMTHSLHFFLYITQTIRTIVHIFSCNPSIFSPLQRVFQPILPYIQVPILHFLSNCSILWWNFPLVWVVLLELIFLSQLVHTVISISSIFLFLQSGFRLSFPCITVILPHFQLKNLTI